MIKLKHYLINTLISSMIGALVEISHALFQHPFAVQLSGLLTSMAVGMLIGTLSMVVISRMMLAARKPYLVYTTNLVVVAAVFGIVSLYFGQTITAIYSARFFFTLLLAEILSCLLIAAWYQQRRALNQKLAEKKVELDKND